MTFEQEQAASSRASRAWRWALAVLFAIMAAMTLIEVVHWVHVEWCHLQHGNGAECRYGYDVH